MNFTNILNSGFSEMMMILQKLRLIDSKDHAVLHPNGPDITWVRVYIANDNNIMMV